MPNFLGRDATENTSHVARNSYLLHAVSQVARNQGWCYIYFSFFCERYIFSRDVLYIKCCQGCMASPLSTTCSFLLDPEHNRSKETFMQDALCNSRAPRPGDGPRYILVVCHEFMSYIHSYTKFGDLHLTCFVFVYMMRIYGDSACG
jgi:hypothetical protein